tara:strand:- start:331 stop:537 length:207 start_codon:yes stop_codon:yes gene_type:complete
MKYCKNQVKILLDEYLELAGESKLINNHKELKIYLTEFITDLCNDLYVTNTGIEPNNVKEWIEKQKVI